MQDDRAADLAAFGLQADFESETQKVFEVWPENAEIVRIFVLMSTQWRHGFDGPTGMDYAVLFPLLAFCDIKEKEKIFEGVRAMELTVLESRAKGDKNGNSRNPI